MNPAAVADCVEHARDIKETASFRHAAFEKLVLAFEAMVFASALRRLHDPDEAKDVAQSAFLAAWQKLEQLRTPEAFGAWLKRLVFTECNRRLRDRPALTLLQESDVSSETSDPREMDWPVARALGALAPSERDAVVLFYFHGYKISEISATMAAPVATIGKRLHAARLKMRRTLPPSLRAEVLRLGTRRRRFGLHALEDYIGTYQFERRPEHLVEIQLLQPGDVLIGRRQGHRDVLFPVGDDTLATQAFDGHGRFHRDESGRVTHFVYYEFGSRLGVARKMS